MRRDDERDAKGRAMYVPFGPYGTMMGMIVILTPILCWYFTRSHVESRIPMNEVKSEIKSKRYYLHICGYLIIIFWKKLTDWMNEPIKVKTGHYTDLIQGFEGNAVLWIQNTFSNPMMTEILNFHYLFIYLFLIYVTTIYYMYTGERDLTDKVTLNYILIYALAVPYYLFFNVEVTSSYIPGMDALLYHDYWYAEFYAEHDPLDNCVPSLHIAIPFGILAINWLHVREKGIDIREWKHFAYHRFIFWNTVLFGFAILYLGIHWIVDIPLGIMIGGIGALFIHHLHPRLRNDYGKLFKGFNRIKLSRHIFIEGIVVLVMFAALMGGLNYQDETMEERPSMILGPNDSNFDIIQPIPEGETAEIFLTNMDDSQSIEIVVIDLMESIQAMGQSEIRWDKLISIQESIVLLPGETHQEIVTHGEEYTLAIVHHPGHQDDEIKVHIYVEYSQGAPVNLALILSLPSLWMTGFVIHRLGRLKAKGMPLTTSLPSHVWNQNDESE
ncbi:MAG: phosphatase PAP2 family protein [Candidatus Thermoplasmatota archaeon]|nr:phosphatase PAP2 family protein [Candidatus Thermoplasmatota archaeon]